MLVFLLYVAGLGVEPSLWDYEPHVHRTLSRDLYFKLVLDFPP